jgi:hypothetical protein
MRELQNAENYCGRDESCGEVDAGRGSAVGVLLTGVAGFALWDVGVNEAARGASGPVVIALSGFSR